MTVDLVYPYGRPLARGVLKSVAEDFFVDEQLSFEPVGEGEHLFLRVEKVGLTTNELIQHVARDFDLKPRDIGYSGLKDKNAVTRQWLSLYLPGREPGDVETGTGYVIVDMARHNRKLRPGTHRSNRFKILIRDVTSVDESFYRQLDSIKKSGMANYFGTQRFGSNSDNVQRALRVFSHAGKSRNLNRTRKSLYLSALRSELFNRILSKRIEQGIWEEPLEGDVFMLAGSQSIFHETVDEGILKRYREFDISSTASLYGKGCDRLGGQALEIESGVFADNPEICQCLDEQGVRLHKRATRIKVENLVMDYRTQKRQLAVEVTLPRGSYLTSLLDHCIDTGNHPDF